MLDTDRIWCHACKCYVEGAYVSTDRSKPESEQQTLLCCRCFASDVQIVDTDDESDEEE